MEGDYSSYMFCLQDSWDLTACSHVILTNSKLSRPVWLLMDWVALVISHSGQTDLMYLICAVTNMQNKEIHVFPFYMWYIIASALYKGKAHVLRTSF